MPRRRNEWPWKIWPGGFQAYWLGILTGFRVSLSIGATDAGKMKGSAVLRLALVSVMLFCGCASYTPSSVRMNPSGPDVKKAIKEVLIVYVEEFATREKSEKAFDADMTAEGVLPILVMMENNGREPFDANAGDIRLRGDQSVKLLAPEDAAIRAQRRTAGRAIGWSLIVPIITIPIAIGASAMHTGNVNQQIVRDFTAKGFPDGAVLPNEERSGFVFFETDGNRKDVAGLTLQVTVRSSNTGQATTVEIPLSAPDRGNTSASSEPFERSRDRRAADGQH